MSVNGAKTQEINWRVIDTKLYRRILTPSGCLSLSIENENNSLIVAYRYAANN